MVKKNDDDDDDDCFENNLTQDGRTQDEVKKTLFKNVETEKRSLTDVEKREKG